MRYSYCSPIRILLPISIGLFSMPFIDYMFLTYHYLPILYFLASYSVLLNFPSIAENLHKKPIYFEDLAIENNNKLMRWYSILMNFILSLLFALCSDYIIFQGIREKPILETLGIIGGSFSLYIKVQHSTGKALLTICHCIKQREIVKRKLSDSIEMTNVTE